MAVVDSPYSVDIAGFYHSHWWDLSTLSARASDAIDTITDSFENIDCCSSASTAIISIPQYSSYSIDSSGYGRNYRWELVMLSVVVPIVSIAIAESSGYYRNDLGVAIGTLGTTCYSIDSSGYCWWKLSMVSMVSPIIPRNSLASLIIDLTGGSYRRYRCRQRQLSKCAKNWISLCA